MQVIILAIICHTSFEPWRVPGCRTMGPSPSAFTIHHTKKTTPAMGTTIALTVNRCRTLWRGIQIAGSEISQKMKKHAKSRVVVPEAAGRWFAMRIISQLDVTSRSAHTNILNTGPYRPQHNKYARSSQTCLHAIPYAIMKIEKLGPRKNASEY